MLIVGNIVDNSPNPKRLAIMLEFSLAVIWGVTGGMVSYILSRYDYDEKLPDLVSYMFVKIMSLA